MGALDYLRGNWNANKRALASAITSLGTLTGAKEYDIGEKLGGVTGAFGEKLVPKAYAADNGGGGQQYPTLDASTGKPTTSFGDLNNGGGGNGGGGGGNGGGGGTGGSEYDQVRAEMLSGKRVWDDNILATLDKARGGAVDSYQRALQAALGVFEAKKQGIMNKIPTLQEQLRQTLSGLDTGLSNFTESANTEEAKRIRDLEAEKGGISDSYVGAERQTRAASKTMARTLRNMFAGAGTLDSTQYRDYNIENSREVAQTMGDIGREKAGKITANENEQGDMKTYYSQQRLQEQKRVALEREKAKTSTDAEIQGALDDATLTDAQKVEAVTAAQERLDTRLAELDTQEITLKQQADKDAKDWSLKMAELSNKGYSDTYKSATEKRKAIDDANSLLKSAVSQWESMNNKPASTGDVMTILNGMPKEYRDYLMPIYFPDKKQLDANGTSGTGDQYGAYLMS